MLKKSFRMILFIPLVLLFGFGAYILPPVRWRVDEAILRLKYQLHPPEKVVFVPQPQVRTTSQALLPSPLPTQTPAPSPSPTPGPTETLAPTATPAPTLPPLPERVSLSGVRYEDQHGLLNYCAPTNLSMALTFWGWPGDRLVAGKALKPDAKDKNVMPYEMVDFILGQTEFRAVERVGGDAETIKRFLAAGFPVLIEKGTVTLDLNKMMSWMGHYLIISGYDDGEEVFITQDSLKGADRKVTYAELIAGWRAFNYLYIITYPPEREADVFALLGADADEATNLHNAAQKSSNEIYSLSGIDQYFAWFNRGTSLTDLQDFTGAAAAYDEAFAIYPSIPEADRPWRMMWYQTGPYKAYLYSGRYYDTLYLADGTLQAMQSEKNLEESYYWRGMARAALGETQAAIEDFRLALKYHPNFEPAVYQLNLLGGEKP